MTDHGWRDGRPPTLAPLTPHQLKREQDRLIAEREHRDKVRREADARYDREQAAKRQAQERAQRERAEAQVAAVRERVERQCRLDGVPERDLKAVVDGARLRREMRRSLGLPA